MIRWHQTADFGFVPNEKMPNTFMAVSMDTYDKKLDKNRGTFIKWVQNGETKFIIVGELHPMNKQTPAWRLAVAGRQR